MDRLLDRLERIFGRLAIENLPMFLTGGLGIAFVLTLLKPVFVLGLILLPQAVLQGEVWRVVSWIFVPSVRQPFFALLFLWMFYLFARDLEGAWGTFRFNAFYFTGMVLTVAAAFLTGAAVTGYYLNGAIFLGYATVFPRTQILLFFVVPVQVRFVGMVTAGLYAYDDVTGGVSERISVGAVFATYLLFFGGTLLGALRGQRLVAKQAARRESMRAAPPLVPVDMGQRVCAICGAKESEGADIRVCSCPKCGGKPRNLCLDHARNH